MDENYAGRLLDGLAAEIRLNDPRTQSLKYGYKNVEDTFHGKFIGLADRNSDNERVHPPNKISRAR